MLKAIGFAAPLLAGAYFFAGSFGLYSRSVDRPVAEVMASLDDLDITEQPGAPGSDASRSGGIQPLFRLEPGPNSMTWVVMSGEQVATRMTARFEPIDGGRRTKVSAEVDRGSAPDDFVSPAFRSEGLTMALFAMALEAELDELTLPAGDPQKCDQLLADFAARNMASIDMQRQDSLKDAVGDTATIIMRLNAMEAELRRNGCSTKSAGEFREISNEMGSGSASPRARQPNVSFEPGKPMVDVTR